MDLDPCACCLVQGRFTPTFTVWKGTNVCSWHLVLSSAAGWPSGFPDLDEARDVHDALIDGLQTARDDGGLPQSERAQCGRLATLAADGRLARQQDEERHEEGVDPVVVYVQ
jgi:hypothetical protein